jgi:hypothetical protein
MPTTGDVCRPPTTTASQWTALAHRCLGIPLRFSTRSRWATPIPWGISAVDVGRSPAWSRSSEWHTPVTSRRSAQVAMRLSSHSRGRRCACWPSEPTSNRRPFSHTLRSSMGQDRYRYPWSGHRSERHFVSINVQGALPPCDSREWLPAAPARCMIQRLNGSSTYCSKMLFEVGTRRVLPWTFCLVAVPRNQGAMT